MMIDFNRLASTITLGLYSPSGGAAHAEHNEKASEEKSAYSYPQQTSMVREKIVIVSVAENHEVAVVAEEVRMEVPVTPEAPAAETEVTIRRDRRDRRDRRATAQQPGQSHIGATGLRDLPHDLQTELDQATVMAESEGMITRACRMQDGSTLTHIEVTEASPANTVTAIINDHHKVGPVEEVFMETWKTLEMDEKAIEFNPLWIGVDGSLANAVGFGPHQVNLQAGDQQISIDDGGRKFIFTGTPIGTVVVFQLYKIHTLDIYSFNATADLEAAGVLPLEGDLSVSGMKAIIADRGDGKGNIGTRLATLRKTMNKKLHNR